jgi:hypothetical protein
MEVAGVIGACVGGDLLTAEYTKKGCKGRKEELLEARRPVGERIPAPTLRSVSE